MISPDFIKKSAVLKQTTEINILREYLQHLFLSFFYQEKDSDQILFKGGTALKFVYGSPRFSEDLDFSAKILKPSKIEKILTEALLKIERENVKVELNEAKTTSGGYLAIYRGSFLEQEISIQLEISLRKEAGAGEAALINQDFIPPYTLMHLAEKKLTAEKLKALLTRAKFRDWYDLYFILRKGLEIDFKIFNFGKKALGEKLLKKTRNLKEREILRELKVLLPVSHRPVLKNFKAVLEREIKRSFS